MIFNKKILIIHRTGIIEAVVTVDAPGLEDVNLISHEMILQVAATGQNISCRSRSNENEDVFYCLDETSAEDARNKFIEMDTLYKRENAINDQIMALSAAFEERRKKKPPPPFRRCLAKKNCLLSLSVEA